MLKKRTALLKLVSDLFLPTKLSTEVDTSNLAYVSRRHRLHKINTN